MEKGNLEATLILTYTCDSTSPYVMSSNILWKINQKHIENTVKAQG
jgi:hypothetical protein